MSKKAKSEHRQKKENQSVHVLVKPPKSYKCRSLVISHKISCPVESSILDPSRGFTSHGNLLVHRWRSLRILCAVNHSEPPGFMPFSHPCPEAENG